MRRLLPDHCRTLNATPTQLGLRSALTRVCTRAADQRSPGFHRARTGAADMVASRADRRPEPLGLTKSSHSCTIDLFVGYEISST
jgi:hypothetical protein